MVEALHLQEATGPVTPGPSGRAPDTATAQLLAWINTHDCGVEPTGVLRDDGSIDIRCQAVGRDGKVTVESDAVRTYGQARAVLGY